MRRLKFLSVTFVYPFKWKISAAVSVKVRKSELATVESSEAVRVTKCSVTKQFPSLPTHALHLGKLSPMYLSEPGSKQYIVDKEQNNRSEQDCERNCHCQLKPPSITKDIPRRVSFLQRKTSSPVCRFFAFRSERCRLVCAQIRDFLSWQITL